MLSHLVRICCYYHNQNKYWKAKCPVVFLGYLYCTKKEEREKEIDRKVRGKK